MACFFYSRLIGNECSLENRQATPDMEYQYCVIIITLQILIVFLLWDRCYIMDPFRLSIGPLCLTIYIQWHSCLTVYPRVCLAVCVPVVWWWIPEFLPSGVVWLYTPVFYLNRLVKMDISDFYWLNKVYSLVGTIYGFLCVLVTVVL